MRPLADNVVIELEPVETVSAGGIHLVAHCTACSGRGAVRHKPGAPPATCTRCCGTGVSGKVSRGSRFARVVASGPGYYAQRPGGCGGTVENGRCFIPNETRPGDRVVVDAQAGQVYDGELSIPRHNGRNGDFGELRIVREGEISAILESAHVA